MKFSKVLVVVMFLTVAVFTAIVITANFKGLTIQPELIYSLFGFLGVEGGAMAWIRNVEKTHTAASGEAASKENEGNNEKGE